MTFREGMRDIIENMVSSFEIGIQNIETVFDTTCQFLNDYHESFLIMEQEKEKVKAELREWLAKNRSLRRKDFDIMMGGIFSIQDERDQEVMDLLKNYLNEQKEVALNLNEYLEKLRISLVRGKVQWMRRFQALINEIRTKQDERKEEVISQLREYQKKQGALVSRLKELMAKGREIQIMDIKFMLKQFKEHHQDQIIHNTSFA